MKIDKNKDMNIKFSVLKNDVTKLVKAIIDSLVATDQVTIKFVENDVKIVTVEDGSSPVQVGATLEIEVKRNI